MDVEGNPATRPQNSARLLKRPSPRSPTANHAERAEHGNGVVKALIRHASKPAEVGLNAQQVDPRFPGLLPDDMQHRARKVDCRDREPALREVNRVSACTASKIDQPSGHGEALVECAPVSLKERVPFEVRILVRGQSRRMRVLPEAHQHHRAIARREEFVRGSSIA